MELICYVYDGWEPRIRPATSRRDWMDDAPEAFPYRCLPLNIANSHGWEMLSPCGFEAEWDGGPAADSVVIRPDAGADLQFAPVSLFGVGTITFHVAGLFRTPSGWNLWAGGPANAGKDGVVPLSGIIETDWSPYSFTMNWRFTRANQVIRFEEDEPFCQFFPVSRYLIEEVVPKFLPIGADPDLKEQFEKWSASRDAFHAKTHQHPPERPSDKWQKLYYRGVDANEKERIADHRSKLKVAEFANPHTVSRASADQEAAPKAVPPSRQPRESALLAKRDWLLSLLERQRALSREASTIYRCKDMTSERFLDQHYAANWPVVLCEELREWPALNKWTPEYLSARIGDREIEFQGCRTRTPDFEEQKDAHRKRLPFDQFIEMICSRHAANDVYVTAYNSQANQAALAPLRADLGCLDKFLSATAQFPDGMPWIGPAGTFTPLHHDLTNNLLVQITGRKRVVMAAPGETPKLYNRNGVYSQIRDLESPDFDLTRYPLAADLGTHTIELNPGEALFIPVGWWHQVTALDFSVSLTYTNFLWPNDASASYPG